MAEHGAAINIEAHIKGERKNLRRLEVAYASDPDSVDSWDVDHSWALIEKIDSQDKEMITLTAARKADQQRIAAARTLADKVVTAWDMAHDEAYAFEVIAELKTDCEKAASAAISRMTAALPIAEARALLEGGGNEL